jgi:hypothetical protein
MKTARRIFGRKYIVICKNRIQSRKYPVHKIIIGMLIGETDKCLIFRTDDSDKRVWKRTILNLIDVTRYHSADLLVNSLENSLI